MSKSDLIGEIVEREARDAINAYIAEAALEDIPALKRARMYLLNRIRSRIQRRYLMLEILDTAAWHPRKVGKSAE